MKYPINLDLETHLLNGCKVIEKESLTFTHDEYTHILIECPKDYGQQYDKEKRACKFISMQYATENSFWYDAVYHYGSKNDAKKYFHKRLDDDRATEYRIKRNKLANI